MARLLEGAHSLLEAWGWKDEDCQNAHHGSHCSGVERSAGKGALCGGKGSGLTARLKTGKGSNFVAVKEDFQQSLDSGNTAGNRL